MGSFASRFLSNAEDSNRNIRESSADGLSDNQSRVIPSHQPSYASYSDVLCNRTSNISSSNSSDTSLASPSSLPEKKMVEGSSKLLARKKSNQFRCMHLMQPKQSQRLPAQQQELLEQSVSNTYEKCSAVAAGIHFKLGGVSSAPPRALTSRLSLALIGQSFTAANLAPRSSAISSAYCSSSECRLTESRSDLYGGSVDVKNTEKVIGVTGEWLEIDRPNSGATDKYKNKSVKTTNKKTGSKSRSSEIVGKYENNREKYGKQSICNCSDSSSMILNCTECKKSDEIAKSEILDTEKNILQLAPLDVECESNDYANCSRDDTKFVSLSNTSSDTYLPCNAGDVSLSLDVGCGDVRRSEDVEKSLSNEQQLDGAIEKSDSITCLTGVTEQLAPDGCTRMCAQQNEPNCMCDRGEAVEYYDLGLTVSKASRSALRNGKCVDVSPSHELLHSAEELSELSANSVRPRQSCSAQVFCLPNECSSSSQKSLNLQDSSLETEFSGVVSLIKSEIASNLATESDLTFSSPGACAKEFVTSKGTSKFVINCERDASKCSINKESLETQRSTVNENYNQNSKKSKKNTENRSSSIQNRNSTSKKKSEFAGANSEQEVIASVKSKNKKRPTFVPYTKMSTVLVWGVGNNRVGLTNARSMSRDVGTPSGQIAESLQDLPATDTPPGSPHIRDFSRTFSDVLLSHTRESTPDNNTVATSSAIDKAPDVTSDIGPGLDTAASSLVFTQNTDYSSIQITGPSIAKNTDHSIVQCSAKDTVSNVTSNSRAVAAGVGSRLLPGLAHGVADPRIDALAHRPAPVLVNQEASDSRIPLHYRIETGIAELDTFDIEDTVAVAASRQHRQQGEGERIERLIRGQLVNGQVNGRQVNDQMNRLVNDLVNDQGNEHLVNGQQVNDQINDLIIGQPMNQVNGQHIGLQVIDQQFNSQQVNGQRVSDQHISGLKQTGGQMKTESNAVVGLCKPLKASAADTLDSFEDLTVVICRRCRLTICRCQSVNLPEQQQQHGQQQKGGSEQTDAKDVSCCPSDDWTEVNRKAKRLIVSEKSLRRVFGEGIDGSLVAGDKLRAICRVSGASVDLEKSNCETTDRTIVIKGTLDQMQAAYNILSTLLRTAGPVKSSPAHVSTKNKSKRATPSVNQSVNAINQSRPHPSVSPPGMENVWYNRLGQCMGQRSRSTRPTGPPIHDDIQRRVHDSLRSVCTDKVSPTESQRQYSLFDGIVGGGMDGAFSRCRGTTDLARVCGGKSAGYHSFSELSKQALEAALARNDGNRLRGSDSDSVSESSAPDLSLLAKAPGFRLTGSPGLSSEASPSPPLPSRNHSTTPLAINSGRYESHQKSYQSTSNVLFDTTPRTEQSYSLFAGSERSSLLGLNSNLVENVARQVRGKEVFPSFRHEAGEGHQEGALSDGGVPRQADNRRDLGRAVSNDLRVDIDRLISDVDSMRQWGNVECSDLKASSIAGHCKVNEDLAVSSSNALSSRMISSFSSFPAWNTSVVKSSGYLSALADNKSDKRQDKMNTEAVLPVEHVENSRSTEGRERKTIQSPGDERMDRYCTPDRPMTLPTIIGLNPNAPDFICMLPNQSGAQLSETEDLFERGEMSEGGGVDVSLSSRGYWSNIEDVSGRGDVGNSAVGSGRIRTRSSGTTNSSASLPVARVTPIVWNDNKQCSDREYTRPSEQPGGIMDKSSSQPDHNPALTHRLDYCNAHEGLFVPQNSVDHQQSCKSSDRQCLCRVDMSIMNCQLPAQSLRGNECLSRHVEARNGHCPYIVAHSTNARNSYGFMSSNQKPFLSDRFELIEGTRAGSLKHAGLCNDNVAAGLFSGQNFAGSHLVAGSTPQTSGSKTDQFELLNEEPGVSGLNPAGRGRHYTAANLGMHRWTGSPVPTYL